MREKRRKTIQDLWLQCYTAEEIGEKVSLTRQAVELELTQVGSDLKKLAKVTFSEEDFQAPIYNVWEFCAWHKLPCLKATAARGAITLASEQAVPGGLFSAHVEKTFR